MQPDPTSPLDLDARAQKWLVGCPIHDAGIPGTCRCPEDDPRTIIRDLLAARDDGRKAYDDLLDLFEEQVAALAEAQRERDEARQARAIARQEMLDNRHRYMRAAEQRDAARADAERKAPVVQKAQRWRVWLADELDNDQAETDLAAAVDTYETQERTDG